MNVRSEKMCVLLDRKDLVDLVDVDDLKVHETMSTMFKYTAPVTESEMERIVSSKAKKIDADPCNVEREVISIIMSFRVMYLKDYTQEVELSWAARLGPEGLESLKRRIPTLDSAERCAICLAGFGVGEELRRTPCMHDFHGTCIANWLKRSHLCSLCRFLIPVCENMEALCPFKEEGSLFNSHRVYRTKPRMSTSFGDEEDDNKLVTKKSSSGGNNKKMAEAKAAASAGFDKAKVIASVGAQKWESGTSVGLKWVKKQYQKKSYSST
ncbi:hypothetical protein EZV62_005285 [Acer yangbiense]|uniref:RING-type domain-containing protein n=1 Tax=Acer yangbiense TaxID=1000413 RepID=A0A5C7IMD1_9ROSI|nr:hypothetical protein EZV62_005285 [Acer yangbiense]